MDLARCAHCETAGIIGAIELKHVDCILSFFSDETTGQERAAFLVLDRGSEDLIFRVGKNVNFPQILPSALAFCTNISKSRLLVQIGYSTSVVHLKVGDKGRVGQPNLACRSGDADMLAFYHDHHFDFDSRDPTGMTPLIAAAEAGQAESIRILVESYGASVTHDDGSGNTALMFASWNGHTDCIRELVRYGADINAVDEDGWPSIASALSLHNREGVARLLFALGARLDIHPKAPDPSIADQFVAQVTIKSQIVHDISGRAGPLGDWFAFVVFERLALV